jgi:hypothetical protein
LTSIPAARPAPGAPRLPFVAMRVPRPSRVLRERVGILTSIPTARPAPGAPRLPFVARSGIPLPPPPPWDFDFCTPPPPQRTNRTPHLHFLIAAPNRNIPPSPPRPRTIQQTPSLPIPLKSSPRRPRIEPQLHQPLHPLDRNDVPNVQRHNLHHHKIHVFLRKRLAIPSSSRLIFRPLTIRPALHLEPAPDPPPQPIKVNLIPVSEWKRHWNVSRFLRPPARRRHRRRRRHISRRHKSSISDKQYMFFGAVTLLVAILLIVTAPAPH